MQHIQQKTNSWQRWALINFVVAVALGLLLRYMQFSPIEGFNFSYITHAHSHVAMLGWLYLAIYTSFARIVLANRPLRYRTYRFWFVFTQITVFGMLVSFLYQGYDTISITFSALHILASYFFVFNLLRDIHKHSLENSVQIRFIKTALYFMVFSTMGVWAMGPVIAIAGKQSVLYDLAIQFYLHFQINGWVVFAVLALLIPRLTKNESAGIEKGMFRFHHLLAGGTICTFLLPVAWFTRTDYLYYANTLGVLLQFMAGWIFFSYVIKGKSHKDMAVPQKWWVLTALIYFGAKIAFQAVLVLPGLAEAAFGNRMLVVGFLHLIMLGFASHYLLAGVNTKTRLAKWASILFISGVAITELLQFIQGGLFWIGNGWIPGFHSLLFVFSWFKLIGIVGLLPRFVR